MHAPRVPRHAEPLRDDELTFYGAVVTLPLVVRAPGQRPGAFVLSCGADAGGGDGDDDGAGPNFKRFRKAGVAAPSWMAGRVVRCAEGNCGPAIGDELARARAEEEAEEELAADKFRQESAVAPKKRAPAKGRAAGK